MLGQESLDDRVVLIGDLTTVSWGCRMLDGKKDGLIRVSQRVHAYLKDNDVPHVWHVDENAHDPVHWKNSLYHFAQRIFGRD